jgi:orotate phosphoribosyltransferase
MISDYKQELLDLIKRDALSFGETRLSSGAESNYYIDKKEGIR